MSLCVRIYNPGDQIGNPGSPHSAILTLPVFGPDPDCVSGLKLVTVSDTESNPDRVQDMSDIFYAFLLVLVAVWGLKQLLNLFSGDTSKD